jgi:O-antigen/teichoic acid export membrane protein
MKQLRELGFIKNLLLTSVIGGLIGVLNYVFNIIVARYTDSTIFGTFSAAMAIMYLIQIPATSIQAMITKRIGENRKYDLNKFKWQSLLIFSSIGIIVSTIFFLTRFQISAIANVPHDVFVYLAIVLFLAFVSPVSKGLLLGTEKIVAVNLIMFGEATLKLIMGIVAIKMGGSLPILMLSNALPALLTTVFIIPLTKLNGEKLEKKITVNYKELILTTITFLLLSAPYTLDLILVNTQFRPEYSAVSLLGKLVYFSAITIAAVMFARLSNQRDMKAEKKTLLISLAGTLGIGVAVTLGLYLFKNFVIGMTIGDQYLSIAPYIALFGLCMTGYAIAFMLANYFISISSFKYIFILVFMTGLQIYLFLTYNNNLLQVLNNQIIVYSSLTVLTLIYLYFTFKKRKNGKENQTGETN